MLEGLGHDVATIAGTSFRSSADPEVLALAFSEDRVLLTYDRDFGELVFRHGAPHRGVIYLRLGTMLVSAISDRIEEVIASGVVDGERFVVVTERRTRVRYS